ncbi:hypothetical protein BS78_06G262800 [Paspalum vaginatum]|nr:hypothetical protein BS78_06G262800 [Paspalum vaginatum]
MAIGSPSPARREVRSVAGAVQPAEDAGVLVPQQQRDQLAKETTAKPKRKMQTLFSFYKKTEGITTDVQGQINLANQNQNRQSDSDENVDVVQEDEPPSPNASVLVVERDPGLRRQIWEYPIDEQDEARRIYIMHGPYQFLKDNYPLSGSKKHPRRFQAHWFKSFPWLEYSPAKDAAFCFPCYLFSKQPSGRAGSNAFTIKGFRSWKKHVFKKQYPEDIRRNRLRLRVSIDAVRWLAFQACAFRGHDESATSKNQGNFLEMVKLLAAYDDDVKAVVLGNAPGNAKYSSPKIQKEILDMMACNVQKAIRNEIGDAKFCLIVDESRDESRREQMALVVRFVDQEGFIRERFLDIVHVHDTTSATLKQELCKVNMRGEWNGLQAKFVAECPYAYYVHWFAHQLQLALVAASKEVPEVQNFFEHLAFVVNTVVSSSKRNDDLHANQVAEMELLIELNELETGRGANQIGTLKRPGHTRWSSHYGSVCSLIKLYKATFLVLKDIANTKGPGTSPSVRGKAAGAAKLMMTFDFVFILHVMKEIMGITDLLCKKLQQKSQDIVNAMDDVVTTKKLIQNLRDHGWDNLLSDVTSFCTTQGIIVPNMEDFYADFIRSRAPNETTIEHHYRYDIFIIAVDQQAQELDCRFGEQATELLILCTSLDPKNSFSSLNIDNVCSLASKFYPADFSEQERNNLRYILFSFHSSIVRLIRLVLTLPVSTATTERVFSAMKLVKTRLRNKMEDGFLRDCMVIYIEREIAIQIKTGSIIDDLYAKKKRKVRLK